MFRLPYVAIVTGCGCHDAANAFKWSLASRFENKDLLRDAYIVVESLRNSWSSISGHLSEWISRRLTFVEDLSMEDIEVWRSIWTSLSVEVETVEVLSSTSNVAL